MIEKMDKTRSKMNLFSDFEQDCFQESIFYLKHKTKLSFLSSILKSGELLPRSKQEIPNAFMCGAPGYSFFMPYSDETKGGKKKKSTIEGLSSSYSSMNGYENGDLSCVELIFDLRMLNDYLNYHGNPGWMSRGAIVHDTKFPFPTISVDFLKHVINGEICFSDPIDLSKYLLEIWVHPRKKDALIQQLKDDKIGSKWLDKIIARDCHPSPDEVLSSLVARREPKPDTSSYSPLLFSKAAKMPADISDKNLAESCFAYRYNSGMVVS